MFFSNGILLGFFFRFVDDHECEQNEKKTMTIESSVQAELLEYHRKMSNYQNSSPLYKDGKALGIVDR